jgi:4-alpha-glucanotransferase
MRFFHLYWIPDGMDAKEGAYVEDFHEDLLRVLALESVRGKFTVVGEDLGTVADHIRDTLHRFGVLSYRLLYFEKDKSGNFKRPDVYPSQALVSLSTHDLPTLAGFWAGADIHSRRRVGVLPDDASYHRQLAERRTEKQRLLEMLHELRLLPDWHPRNADYVPELTGELHSAFVGFLAGTPSRLMLINQEDLLKDPEQQNLPGTTEQYPNWRHKMRFMLEELHSLPEARDYAAMLRHWIGQSGRLR